MMTSPTQPRFPSEEFYPINHRTGPPAAGATARSGGFVNKSEYAANRNAEYSNRQSNNGGFQNTRTTAKYSNNRRGGATQPVFGGKDVSGRRGGAAGNNQIGARTLGGQSSSVFSAETTANTATEDTNSITVTVTAEAAAINEPAFATAVEEELEKTRFETPAPTNNAAEPKIESSVPIRLPPGKPEAPFAAGGGPSTQATVNGIGGSNIPAAQKTDASITPTPHFPSLRRSDSDLSEKTNSSSFPPGAPLTPTQPTATLKTSQGSGQQEQVLAQKHRGEPVPPVLHSNRCYGSNSVKSGGSGDTSPRVEDLARGSDQRESLRRPVTSGGGSCPGGNSPRRIAMESTVDAPGRVTSSVRGGPRYMGTSSSCTVVPIQDRLGNVGGDDEERLSCLADEEDDDDELMHNEYCSDHHRACLRHRDVAGNEMSSSNIEDYTIQSRMRQHQIGGGSRQANRYDEYAASAAASSYVAANGVPPHSAMLMMLDQRRKSATTATTTPRGKLPQSLQRNGRRPFFFYSAAKRANTWTSGVTRKVTAKLEQPPFIYGMAIEFCTMFATYLALFCLTTLASGSCIGAVMMIPGLMVAIANVFDHRPYLLLLSSAVSSVYLILACIAVKGHLSGFEAHTHVPLMVSILCFCFIPLGFLFCVTLMYLAYVNPFQRQKFNELFWTDDQKFRQYALNYYASFITFVAVMTLVNSCARSLGGVFFCSVALFGAIVGRVACKAESFFFASSSLLVYLLVACSAVKHDIGGFEVYHSMRLLQYLFFSCFFPLILLSIFMTSYFLWAKPFEHKENRNLLRATQLRRRFRLHDRIKRSILSHIVPPNDMAAMHSPIVPATLDVAPPGMGAATKASSHHFVTSPSQILRKTPVIHAHSVPAGLLRSNGMTSNGLLSHATAAHLNDYTSNAEPSPYCTVPASPYATSYVSNAPPANSPTAAIIAVSN